MRKLLLTIFLFFFIVECFPQDSIISPEQQIVKYDTESKVKPMSFDEETLQKYKNDEAFNYVDLENKENWWTRFQKWIAQLWSKFWHWLLGDYDPNGLIAFMIRIIPYIILIGIIVFIVWLFFKLNPGVHFLKSKEKPTVFFTEEEEIIKTKDIQQLIQKALADKNYRLAVRYYYLMILKKLTAAEVIVYEFDKTNNDYIAEITSEAINLNFKKATVLYDYIWYGNFDVSKTDFSKAQHIFVDLEQQIPEAID